MEYMLDPTVSTILNGTDLSKYAPLFEKCKVNFKLFLSLTEEDLKEVGMVDQEDINTLLKRIQNFRRGQSDQLEDLKPLEYAELAQILENTVSQVHFANVATAYVQNKIDDNEPIDALLSNNKSVSWAMSRLIERIKEENKELIREVESLIKGEEETKTLPYKKVVINLSLGTLLVCSFIAGFAVIRKKFF